MDLLNSTPVIELSGNEFLPIEGKTFVDQVEEFFKNQGGVAHSPFGDVLLDLKVFRIAKVMVCPEKKHLRLLLLKMY